MFLLRPEKNPRSRRKFVPQFKTSACVFLFMILLSYFFAGLNSFSSQFPEPVFHFNFRGSGGQSTHTDLSGRHQCHSRQPLAEMQNALRIAPSGHIRIPGSSIPDLSRGFTVSCWILKRSTPDAAPMLTRGTLASRRRQFIFSLGWKYPALYTSDAHSREGLYYIGISGSGVHYPRPMLLPGAVLPERSGIWHQITGVWDSSRITIYVDSTPAAEYHGAPVPADTKEDLYIGAEPQDSQSIHNHICADALLNDLRLYSQALSPQNIQQLYREDRARYPEGILFPERNHLDAIPACSNYLPEGFDPDFSRKLKITREFEEKELPHLKPLRKLSSRICSRGEGQALQLLFNNQPVYPMQAKAVYMDQNGKYRLRENSLMLRDFAAAGVHEFGVIINDDPRTGRFWIGEGKYDFRVVDGRLKKALEASPDARIMLNIHIPVPDWFKKKYPGEVEVSRTPDGKEFPADRFGSYLGSRIWMEVNSRMLEDLVRHVEQSPYGLQVYAYLVGGGGSGEWYWPGTFRRGIPGYSQGTAESFRCWLKKKYRNDPRLPATQWKAPVIPFEQIQVPSPKERLSSGTQLLRNPATAGKVIDFRLFLSDITLAQQNAAIHAIRQAAGSSKLIGIYGGYSLNMTARKQFVSGLFNSARQFQNPELDFLATPIDYANRLGTQAGQCVNPFQASCRLNSKLLWEENDLRPHFHIRNECGRTQDMHETLKVIERGYLNALISGSGIWWYQFHDAWFHHDDIMEMIRKIHQNAGQYVQAPRKSAAEIAVIFDEFSANFAVTPKQPLLYGNSYGFYQESTMAGLPVDFYHTADLDNPRMPDYKIYVFPNLFYADDDLIRSVHKKISRPGVKVIWQYGSGCIGKNVFSASRMKKLTGLSFRTDTGTHTISQLPAENAPFAVHNRKKYRLNPLMLPNQKNMKILSHSGDIPLMVEYQNGNNQHIYAPLPLDHQDIRRLCQYLGAHVYLDSSDIFNINSDIAMIHARTPGRKIIRLPAPRAIYNGWSGKLLRKNTRSISVDMKPMENAFFRLGTPIK